MRRWFVAVAMNWQEFHWARQVAARFVLLQFAGAVSTGTRLRQPDLVQRLVSWSRMRLVSEMAKVEL